jgi:hypothetical protein
MAKVPAKLLQKEFIGKDITGKVNLQKTLKLKWKEPSLYVSDRIRFSFLVKLNLLLMRFHAEMMRGLYQSHERLSFSREYHDVISRRIIYHLSFLYSFPYFYLIDEALNFDPFEYSIEQELKMESTLYKDLADILDLWEAYISQKATFVDFAVKFDLALKPMSKIYELWCLKKLVDLIIELTNSHYEEIKSFPCTFMFSQPQINLYYDGGGPHKKVFEFSNVLSKLYKAEITPSPWLRPDYVMTISYESDEIPVIIADAKYQYIDRIDSDSFSRLLAYAKDYISEFKGITNHKLPYIILFGISEEEIVKKVTLPDFQFLLISLRPCFYQNVKKELREIISVLLDLKFK